jgi:hypothetical protein
MIYLLAGTISFVSVFLRVFQQKNIMGNHYKLAFFTSYAMAFAEAASIGFVVTNGLWMALPVGTGAAFGVVCSMYLHRRFFNKTQTK